MKGIGALNLIIAVNRLYAQLTFHRKNKGCSNETKKIGPSNALSPSLTTI